ncbi:MAG: hypothetical protein ABL921_33410 [Pirellula sp.]
MGKFKKGHKFTTRHPDRLKKMQAAKPIAASSPFHEEHVHANSKAKTQQFNADGDPICECCSKPMRKVDPNHPRPLNPGVTLQEPLHVYVDHDHPDEPARTYTTKEVADLLFDEFQPDDEVVSSGPYPTRKDFNSDEEYYAYHRNAMAEFGLAPEAMHMDMVDPEFVEKLRVDFVGTMKASKFWPKLVQEEGLERAEAILQEAGQPNGILRCHRSFANPWAKCSLVARKPMDPITTNAMLAAPIAFSTTSAAIVIAPTVVDSIARRSKKNGFEEEIS